MEPASAEHLLEALRLFDRDSKGTLSRELISKLMTEEGEPFTQVASTWPTNFQKCSFLVWHTQFVLSKFKCQIR